MERRPLYANLDMPQAQMGYTAKPNQEMPGLSERNWSLDQERVYNHNMAQSSGSPTRGYPYNHNLSRQPYSKGFTFDSPLLKQRDSTLVSTLPGIYEDVVTLPVNVNPASMPYQQDDISCLQQEVMKSPLNLKSMEIEREEALANLQHLTIERDSLVEQLRLSRERGLSDRVHQMQRVEDLQATILTMDEERSKYMNRQSMMEEDMLGMEEEIRSLGCKLDSSEEELKKIKAECTSLRQLKSKSESALGDSQRNLISKIRELRNIQDRNKQLEERNDSLLKQVNGLTQEASILQSTVSQMNQDKDTLQKQLDDKQQLIESLRLRIEELEKSTESIKQDFSSRDRQLEAMQKYLADTKAELDSVKKEKEAILESSGYLKVDLDKLHLDNQALLCKMEGCNQEMDALQSQLHKYATEASSTNEVIASKDETIQRLQLAVNELETSSENLKQVINRRHLELATARSEMSDMGETVDAVMREKGALLEANSHLRAKLENAYLDNQALLWKLEESNQEVQVLQRNLSDYVAETSCTNQLLSSDEEVIQRLQQTVKDLESSAGSLQQAVRGRDEELEAMKKNVAETEAELKAVMREKETVLETNTHLIADLDKAFLDIQSLQCKLAESSEEVEALQRRVQNYDAEMSSMEEQLSSKDQIIKNLKLTVLGLEKPAGGPQEPINRRKGELEALQLTNIPLRANLDRACLDNKALQQSSQDMKVLHRELLDFKTQFSGLENCLSSNDEVIGRLKLAFDGLEVSANSLRKVVVGTDQEQREAQVDRKVDTEGEKEQEATPQDSMVVSS